MYAPVSVPLREETSPEVERLYRGVPGLLASGGNRNTDFSFMRIEAEPQNLREIIKAISQGLPSRLEAAAYVAIISATGETCIACDKSSRVSYCRTWKPTCLFLPPHQRTPLLTPSVTTLEHFPQTVCHPRCSVLGPSQQAPSLSLSIPSQGVISAAVPEQPCWGLLEKVGSCL